MASVQLPTELKLTLRAGTVYYFQHRELSSVEPHYFVVINANPQAGSVILLTVGSSQIDKVRARRKGMPPETLVEVHPVEYGDFSRPTIMDCNQLLELSLEELVQKFKLRELRYHKDLPRDILVKLWRGVRLSPRVDDAHKRLLPQETGDNEAMS